MTSASRTELLEFVYLAPYERMARSEIPEHVERAFESLVIADPNIGDVVPGLGGARNVQGDLSSEQRKRIRQVVSDLR